MKQAELKQVNQQQYQLTGELNVDTVVKLESQVTLLLADSNDLIELDLGQLTHSDTSGLALLLSWLRRLAQNNKSMTMTNIPQQLKTIAQVSGVLELLGSEFSG